MNNILKKRSLLIGIVFIFIGISVMLFWIFVHNKKDKIVQMEEAIENIFFYLPEKEYTNLNEMSDYCKISLVYGTDFLKRDVYLSKEDYDTIVKSKRNSVSGYKIDNVLKSVRKVIGSDATINFDVNEDGDYNFLTEDSCAIGNNSIGTLSYNELSKYIFTINKENNKNSKLYVKWEKPIFENDEVYLTAYALLTIKNADGGYDVYADSNLSHKVDSIKGGNIKYKIKSLYYKSNIYKFTLKKVNENYVWINYKMDDIFEEKVIYD